MPILRPELARGSAVLLVFLVFIVGYSALGPLTIQTTEYAYINLYSLSEAPAAYEGMRISSAATVSSALTNASGSFIETAEGVMLFLPLSIDAPPVGQRIMFRGVSNYVSDGVVTVHEVYELDYNSSPIRSIPGILLFVILFFVFFTIDFRQLAFVRKD